jgi:hypothetical protein
MESQGKREFRTLGFLGEFSNQVSHERAAVRL